MIEESELTEEMFEEMEEAERQKDFDKLRELQAQAEQEKKDKEFAACVKKYDALLYTQMYPLALVKDFMKKAYFDGKRKGVSQTNDYWQDQNEELYENYEKRLKSLREESEKLKEAKEIIRELLGCLQQDTNDPETNYYVVKYMDKAEAFLKE